MVRCLAGLLLITVSAISTAQQSFPGTGAVPCSADSSSSNPLDESLASSLNWAKESLVVREGSTFENQDLSRESCSKRVLPKLKLSNVDASEISLDLERLLHQIWHIEEDLILPLDSAQKRNTPLIHLHAELDGGNDFSAWACSKLPDTLAISSSFMACLANDALDQAIELMGSDLVVDGTFGDDDDPATRRRASLDRIRDIDFHPMSERAIEALSIDEQNNRGKLFEESGDLYFMVKRAQIQYYQALLFVLGHEAAHHWFDRCSEKRSRAAEVRADAFGLLVSTTAMGEQYLSVISKEDVASLRKRRLADLLAERDEARTRLKANQYKSLSVQGMLNDPFEPDRGTDRYLTSRSYSQIRAEVSSEVGNPDAFFLRPLGELGYETMSAVYNNSGFIEYSKGDFVHPSLADRVDHLDEEYKQEILKADGILISHFRSRENLDRSIADVRLKLIGQAVQPLIQMFSDHCTAKERKP